MALVYYSCDCILYYQHYKKCFLYFYDLPSYFILLN